MQCKYKYELNVKNINKEEKKKMLYSLIDYNMFFECFLMCKLFIKNIDLKREKDILNDIIKICKTTQNKSAILQMVKEW